MAIEALYLFDVNEQFMDLIPGEELLEHGQTQELKKLITANASALYSEDLEQAVFIGHRDIDDSNVFHQYKVTRFKNNNGIVEIEGVHAFFDDMQAYGYIKDKRPTDATAATALGGILEGSRWQIGVNQCTTSATSNYYYVSRLEAFWDFVEKWSVEFKLRMVYSDGVIIARYIDIYDQLSADYGKWYEYGDQLLTVEKEEDRQGVYTALIGQGKGEETEAGGFGRKITFEDVEWSISLGDPVDKPLLQEYVELPSATAQYGYSDGTPRVGIVQFDDITDPALLLESAYYTLLNNCRPQVQFRAGVDEKGVSEIGEIVSILRDDLNIRYKTRVYKLRRNFLDKMDKQFTFGDKLTTSQGERSVQINKDLKKQQQQTISWLEVVNAAMMSMFWNEDGYNYTFSAVNDYNLPGGFYSFNAPIDMNPTKCIYMGAGMLAIANSKLPDGSWNFRTWGTGDGFTADLINAGTIVGTNMQLSLESGVQTFTDPSTGLKLHLDKGAIYFEDTAGQKRYLRYNAEGLINEPDQANTGTSLNTAFILKGGNGSHKYFDFIDFDDPSGTNRARIDATGPRIRMHVGGEGIEVRDNVHYDETDAWAPIRASLFRTTGTNSAVIYEDRWETPRDGNRSLVASPNGTGKLYVSTPEQDAFYAVWASSFDVSSSIEFKKAIEDYLGNATELINGTPVRLYHLNEDVEGVDIKRIGLIVQESPLEVINPDGGKTIDLYSMASLLWKSVQEQSTKINDLEARLTALENGGVS